MQTITNSKVCYLFSVLKDYIDFCTEFQTVPENITSIEILDDQSSLYAGRIYLLAKEEDLRTLEQRIIFPGAILILSREKDRLERTDETDGGIELREGVDGTDPSAENPRREEKRKRDFIGLIVSMSFPSLYNCLNRVLLQYQSWKYQLFQVRLDQFTLDYLLKKAEQDYGRKMYFLDRDKKLIYGSEDEEFRENCLVIADTAPERIFTAKLPNETRRTNDCRKIQYGGHSYYFCRITMDHYQNGQVVIRENKPEEIDLPTLCLLLARAIETRLKASIFVSMDYDRTFEALIEDMANGKVNEEKDFERRFLALPHPVQPVIRCIVIRFDSDSLNDQLHLQLLHTLEQEFPECNTAVRRNEVVLLLTYEEGPSDLEPEVRENLEKILVQYRASAGVTEPFRRYGHFMTQYRLARKLLKIGLMVRFHSEERIFTRGNYMDYQLIDMALRSFVQEYGHYNFAYLIHPSVVRLAKYDKLHGTDFLPLLHAYLINNQSASRTASSQYMHRNTVLNKIKKISSLIGCDLNDPSVQHQFLLSCCLMRYSNCYLHRDLLASDFVFYENGKPEGKENL